MSFILVAAAGALCAALFASAAAAEPALSLPQAVQLAARDSRLIAAASAQADAARQMALAAGQRPDPVLKAGLNNLPIDGADRFSTTRDSMTMRSVSLMQELTRSDKRAARAARFEREGEAALRRPRRGAGRRAARHRAGVARPALSGAPARAAARAACRDGAADRRRRGGVSRRPRCAGRRVRRARRTGAARRPHQPGRSAGGHGHARGWRAGSAPRPRSRWPRRRICRQCRSTRPAWRRSSSTIRRSRCWRARRRWRAPTSTWRKAPSAPTGASR